MLTARCAATARRDPAQRASDDPSRARTGIGRETMWIPAGEVEPGRAAMARTAAAKAMTAPIVSDVWSPLMNAAWTPAVTDACR